MVPFMVSRTGFIIFHVTAILSDSTIETSLKLGRILVLYQHTVSNNLKVISKRYGVQMVFKKGFRLLELTPFHNRKERCPNKSAANQDETQDWRCVTNICCLWLLLNFANWPLFSRQFTEVQNGCRNVRNNSTSSLLLLHLLECRNCHPTQNEWAFLDYEEGPEKRLIKKNERIATADNCLSAPSVVFSGRMKAFLLTHAARHDSRACVWSVTVRVLIFFFFVCE